MAAANAPPAELLIDDAYHEILLRLPADRPKLLHRFTIVSKTWRRILTDPTFLHSYREFHGVPRLLGYVHDGGKGPYKVVAKFISTDTTFRPLVPKKGVDLHVYDSRHGRVIFEKFGESWTERSCLIIWDPVADHHEEVPLPKEFARDEFNFTATILCDEPGCDHLDCHGGPFRVVFLGVRDGEKGAWATSAYNYTSDSGSWTASPAAAAAFTNENDWGFPMPAPSTLVGGTTLYFRSPRRILRYWFGDEMERLMYVDIPPFVTEEARGTVLMPAADGRLSFAAMFGDNIRFWETKVRADGAVKWVHSQTALIPVPGVLLIGAAGSFLFMRNEDDKVIAIDVGSGGFQMLPQPDDKQISGLIPFMVFRA